MAGYGAKSAPNPPYLLIPIHRSQHSRPPLINRVLLFKLPEPLLAGTEVCYIARPVPSCLPFVSLGVGASLFALASGCVTCGAMRFRLLSPSLRVTRVSQPQRGANVDAAPSPDPNAPPRRTSWPLGWSNDAQVFRVFRCLGSTWSSDSSATSPLSACAMVCFATFQN